jgi:hypothetical protein
MRAPLCEGVVLGRRFGVALGYVYVFRDVVGEGIEGIDHFERVMHLGHILHRRKQIEWGLHLLVHGWS